MELYRINGTQNDDEVYFELKDFATNKELVNATLVAGDVQVSLDHNAFQNVGFLPSQNGTSGVYRWIRTPSEVSATFSVLKIVDQTGSKVWADKVIYISTISRDANKIGGIDVSTLVTFLTSMFSEDYVAQIGATTTSLQPNTTANARDIGKYIVFTDGPCIGQSRLITGIAGSSYIISPPLTVAPDKFDNFYLVKGFYYALNVAYTALTSRPSAKTGLRKDILQLIAYIVKGKKTETDSLQTVREPGDTGDFGTRSVAEAGGTTTVGELL